MSRLKLRRPSHTTVVAYLCLFLLLSGGAYAAQKIGSGQLKKNAVTTSKFKNGAVTTKKFKNGAVNGAKVADGSISAVDVNAPSLPVSRITQKLRGNSTVPVSSTAVVYPLDNPTYTQAGDENDLYAGAMDVTFQPTCTGDRTASAAVVVDSTDPTHPMPDEPRAASPAAPGSSVTASTPTPCTPASP